MVLAIIASNALAWTVVLALPGRAPLWLLVVLIVVISVGGPGSMVGFDFARTFNPSATLGTAQGMVNMGGFVASLLVMQAMGLILGAAGGYLVRVVPAGVDGAVRGLGARRRRHPDHPPQGAQTDESRAGTHAAGGLRASGCSRRRTGSPSGSRRARRLAFLIAATNSSLFIVERPEMSSRRATSIKCFLDALASTPSADLPVGVRAAAARRARRTAPSRPWAPSGRRPSRSCA